jgi:hypothetical protein
VRVTWNPFLHRQNESANTKHSRKQPLLPLWCRTTQSDSPQVDVYEPSEISDRVALIRPRRDAVNHIPVRADVVGKVEI